MGPGGNMELHTYGLSLKLHFGKPTDEGWLVCSVVVDVPGFHGKLDCHVMQADLQQFRSQLAQAIDRIGEPTEVRLVGTEPGIDLVLTVNRLGQIHGTYELRNLDAPGSPALAGSFDMDQTFLRPLLSEVDRDLKAMAWF